MDFKKGIIFLVLTVLLFSIASASAADMNETATTSTDEYEIELSQNDDEIVSVENDLDESYGNPNNSSTFSELNSEISGRQNVELNYKYYSYNGSGSTIEINIQDSVIDGKGAVIDMAGSNFLPFRVTAQGVTFKNLTIINANNKAGNGGAIYFTNNAAQGTVTNCNFTNNNASYGGAVFFEKTGNVTNCNFTNNRASDGGAITMYSGTVSNCNFVNNTAGGNGGAVCFWSIGDVSNCNFVDNKATGTYSSGGAIYMSSGSVENCNFTNNTARYGGAVYFADTGDVTNCNFTNNTAGMNGGAIDMNSGTVSNCNFTGNTAYLGGAVYFNEDGDVTNCNFTNNTATNGGAIYFTDDAAQGNVTNCNFVDNKATGTESWGGAIRMNSGTVTNCNFTNNTAYLGGAVYVWSAGDVTNCNFTGNTADVDGGAVYFVNSGNVTNCNFINNKATGENSWGGAVYFNQNGDVTNCNFVDNKATGTYSGGGAIRMYSGTVTNCNFTNNTAIGGGAINIGSGNVTNCNFTNNTAIGGGAIYMALGSVENCNFVDNKATGTYSSGGAIYMALGSVENCNFVDNKATGTDSWGGAVFFDYNGDVTNCNFINNNASERGGAVFFGSAGDVTNCNFTGNNAAWGSAIYFFKSYSSGKLTISNSTLLNNRASVDYNTALNVTINENNITITFVGQNNLLNAIYSRDDAQVTFSNVTYWGEKGKEIANSTRSGSNKEAGQNITIAVVVNDVIVFNGVEVTDDNGTIVLDNIKVDGDYCILARHNLDSYYTEAQTILTSIPYYVNVTSQATNNKTVNITAKSNIYDEIMPGELLFILPNGTEISANYSAGGIWWAEYEFSNPGVYNVSASYSSGEVNVTEGTITILADVPIIVSDMIITFGDDAVVVVSVPDAINGQNITIAVNSSSKNATVKNGKANATFTNLAFGDYVIVVAYLGDELNSANSTTAKLTVNKATPIIEVQSYDTTYPEDVVITVKSDIAGLYVVKVGDMTQNVTLEAGVEQNVTFTGLPINEEGYVVNVTNTDLENCTQSVNDTNIVKVMRPHSYINTDGLITVYNTGGVLFVSLTGIDGEPLAGRGIKVNISGKTYTIITNASGIAGLPINLKAGLHPAYVWFNGDSTYAPSENISTSVEVYTDSRITGNKDLVKRQGGSEPFKVRALDKYGKPVGAYAKVKMTVAGKTYTVWTDAKGYASLPINLKVGKYKITTVYGGTTVTNTITVKK